jgi:signal transduction histidine kinase/ActR/RegA family two-component response regulator
LDAPDAITPLADVMAARDGQLRMRLVLAAITALLFHPLTGPLVAACWLGIYAWAQALESFVFTPARTPRLVRSRAGAALALGWLVLQQVIWGAYAVFEAASHVPGATACAILLVAGAIFNGVLVTRHCRPAFLATVGPEAAYFVIVPMVARLPPWETGALIVAGLLNVAVTVLVWTSTWRALAAERAARLESDVRRAEAESAVGAKSAFVAVVSHELRTPITAILAGAAELERCSDPSAKAHARLITDGAKMMRTLLNDLLDKAKLDAGRLAVEAGPFDLRSLLADAMRFWRAEAKKRRLRLRFEGSASTPRALRGDATRLRQILNNLISNALKFTDAGEVTVSVTGGPTADDAVALAFTVRDTGPGVSADQIGRLFTPFEQLEAPEGRHEGGTGLGLAISRDLARLMGGDIDVESAPGAGATFTLRLTFEPAALATADVVAEPEAAPDGLSLLVVDDHQINRRALSLMLAPFGASVTCAASGAEALAILATEPFDAVLMDCHMPGMDGRAATRVLRAGPGPNRTAPVIAVTASVGDQDIRECRAAGMNAHLAKPIDPAALHAILVEVLSPAKTRAEVA